MSLVPAKCFAGALLPAPAHHPLIGPWAGQQCCDAPNALICALRVFAWLNAFPLLFLSARTIEYTPILSFLRTPQTWPPMEALQTPL